MSRNSFIKLTNNLGEEISVRIDCIQSVQERKPDGACDVWLIGAQHPLYTNNSYSNVMKFLSEHIEFEKMS